MYIAEKIEKVNEKRPGHCQGEIYVQDALNTLGYGTGGLDGVFGAQTRNAVLTFQSRNGLSADGILGPLTWSRLMSQVNGIGRTSTVIN